MSGMPETPLRVQRYDIFLRYANFCPFWNEKSSFFVSVFSRSSLGCSLGHLLVVLSRRKRGYKAVNRYIGLPVCCNFGNPICQRSWFLPLCGSLHTGQNKHLIYSELHKNSRDIHMPRERRANLEKTLFIKPYENILIGSSDFPSSFHFHPSSFHFRPSSFLYRIGVTPYRFRNKR